MSLTASTSVPWKKPGNGTPESLFPEPNSSYSSIRCQIRSQLTSPDGYACLMKGGEEPVRIDTGVSGLNDILSGGLPPGQMYLLEGDPGTGKTTLAMQFILAGTRVGDRALYIALSESKSELEGSARSKGWNTAELPIAEFIPAEASLTPEQQYTVFHASEIELAGTIHKLTQLIDELKPDRVVIDSLSELRLLAADTMRYRRQLLALKHFLPVAKRRSCFWVIAPLREATCSSKASRMGSCGWRRFSAPTGSRGGTLRSLSCEAAPFAKDVTTTPFNEAACPCTLA